MSAVRAGLLMNAVAPCLVVASGFVPAEIVKPFHWVALAFAVWGHALFLAVQAREPRKAAVIVLVVDLLLGLGVWANLDILNVTGRSLGLWVMAALHCARADKERGGRERPASLHRGWRSRQFAGAR